MTDKLTVYNGALNAMTEPPLVSLIENRPARKTLDAFYETAIQFCLEQGRWIFATRLLKLDASVSVTPAFGYKNFFEKPADYINIVGIWSDEMLSNPLGYQYDNDKDGFYSNQETIYLKYISDDIGYGRNLNKWSTSFLRYVELYFASITAKAITHSRVTAVDLKDDLMQAHKDALRFNEQEQPVKRFPTGSWVQARTGGYANNGNRYCRYSGL